MQNVLVKPLVNKKLNELFEALLEDNYFSEQENALAYCDNLEQFILSISEHKHCKTRNNRYGEFYATYKANRRTTWLHYF